MVMNFRRIPRVLSSQELIDLAFRRSTREARKLSSSMKAKKFKKIKKLEEKKVELASREARGYLDRIVDTTPSFDHMPEFYYSLVSLIVDVDRAKKSLGALKWASGKLYDLERKYRPKIRRAGEAKEAQGYRKEFFGRLASVLKQVGGELEYIKYMQKELKDIPVVKDEFTVVLAGAPNVGKSSLLKAITGAEPRIESYPFTTKQILLGYFKHGVQEFQLVDTPGILDRGLKDMNPLERQSVVALDSLADFVIFVFDPSGSCGYSLKEQGAIFRNIQKNFNWEISIALNKADIAAEEEMERAQAMFSGYRTFICSATQGEGIEELRKQIVQKSRGII